jgi:hypothetical protein
MHSNSAWMISLSVSMILLAVGNTDAHATLHVHIYIYMYTCPRLTQLRIHVPWSAVDERFPRNLAVKSLRSSASRACTGSIFNNVNVVEELERDFSGLVQLALGMKSTVHSAKDYIVHAATTATAAELIAIVTKPGE